MKKEVSPKQAELAVLKIPSGQTLKFWTSALSLTLNMQIQFFTRHSSLWCDYETGFGYKRINRPGDVTENYYLDLEASGGWGQGQGMGTVGVC